jgi:hypothetical protein
MTKTRSIISLIIVALVALTIPQAQAGGPNIYANGDNLVIAAGATNAYQDLVLENIQGKLEWGEILGIRVSSNRALTADVAVVLGVYGAGLPRQKSADQGRYRKRHRDELADLHLRDFRQVRNPRK